MDRLSDDLPRAPLVGVDALSAFDAHIARLASALIADPGAADDVAQEVRFAAWRRPPRDAWRFARYVSRLAARFASNRRREDARRGRRERAAARPETDASAHVAEREEARRRLWDAVEGLDAPYREVVRLGWFDGRKPGEIARALGVPVETVRTRQKRALAKLREILDRGYGGRDAWISALLPLCRADLVAVGTAVGGGMILAKAKVAVGAAVVAALAWWGAAGGFGATSDRNGGAATVFEGGTPAFAATASRPRVDGAADSRAVASDVFADPDADRATFVVVRERDRAPVADAETALVRPGGAKDLARTDAAGVVRFGASRGKGQLAVRTASRPTSVFDVGLGAGRTEIVLAEGLTLRGRVTVDGKPPGEPIALRIEGLEPAGVRTAATFDPATAFEPSSLHGRAGIRVVADHDGAFRVEGVLASRFASLTAYCDDERFAIDPAVVEPQRAAPCAQLPVDDGVCALPLRRCHAVRGRLRAADGLPPPAGAFVQVLALAARGGSSGTGDLTRAIAVDPAGAFSAPLPFGLDDQGIYKLVVVAYVGLGAPAAEFDFAGFASGPKDVGDMRLPPQRRVRCIVRDARGDPFRGAKVGDVDRDDRSPEAETDDEGAVELALPPGPRRLRITAPGCNVVYPAVSEDATSVDAVLTSAGRLELRVFDADGGPVPNAALVVRRPWRAPPIPSKRFSSAEGIERGWCATGIDPTASPPEGDVETQGATDGAGVFALRGLAPGDEIEAEVFGYGPPRRARLGSETTRLDFHVPADAQEFALRVEGPDGAPPPNAIVRFVPEGPSRPVTARRPGFDGVFRVRAAGWTGVRAEAGGYPDFEVRTVEVKAAGEGPTTVVRLQPARKTRIDVVDDAGEPFAGAVVDVDYRAGVTASIDNLGPSSFVLSRFGDGVPTLRAGFQGWTTSVTPKLDAAETRLVLPSTGWCEFVLSAREPSPRDVRAILRSDDVARSMVSGRLAAVSERLFRLRLRAPVGRYGVSVEGAEFAGTREVRPTVEIRRNETTRVELRAP